MISFIFSISEALFRSVTGRWRNPKNWILSLVWILSSANWMACSFITAVGW